MHPPSIIQTRRLAPALALMLLLAHLFLALHQSQHLDQNATEDCQVCLLGTAPGLPAAAAATLPDAPPAGFAIARVPAPPLVSLPTAFRPRAPPAASGA